jgi:monothiol glutaredoxin
MHNFIDGLVKKNKVVLFMKGTAIEPECGFSQQVVNILKLLSVDFTDVNILDSEELRSAIKTYSNWPTVPQLYANGQFVGGCDIVTTMYKDGTLVELLTQS